MPAPIPPKENSGASGGFLPKHLLLRLRLPNSKTNQPKFWQILSPKNSFAKTSSTLKPRHTARILGGQNPERKIPFPFSRKNSPSPHQKCKECFFFRGCWRTRQCVGLSPSVQFSFKPPRGAERVPPSGFEKAVKFCSGGR